MAEQVSGWSGNEQSFDTFTRVSYSWQHIERPAFDTYTEELDTSARVLDIGCGNGRIVRYLLDNGFHSSQIIGADNNPQMAELAAQQTPEVDFVVADVSQLPFRDESFDAATSCMTTHLLDAETAARFLKEAFRTLRPNGQLIMVDAEPETDEEIGVWTTKKTPWSSDLGIFGHDYDTLLGGTARDIGFVIVTNEIIPVQESGKTNPEQYQKYAAGHRRRGIILKKPALF